MELLKESIHRAIKNFKLEQMKYVLHCSLSKIFICGLNLGTSLSFA
jgi:hypothetical protein